MSRHQFDKATANLLLEAVRGTVGHLSRMRLLPESLRPGEDHDLVAIYGQARRLLGYMQQAGRTYDASVQLGLEEDDIALLTDCALFEVGKIEKELTEVRLVPTRRGFLEASRNALEGVVRSLAVRPLRSIPGDPNAALPRPRALAREIGRRQVVESGDASPLFGETPRALRKESEPPPGRTAGATPQVARPQSAVASPRSERPVVPLRLVEPKRIRNEHLRSLAVLDQEAWRRSLADRDVRAAAVHLEAIVEAVVVDRALPRAAEFELRGTPDRWNLQDLLGRLLPHLDPLTRSRLQLLGRCRDLVRPAVQLQSPLPMTATLLSELAQVALRVLDQLGVRQDLEQV